MMNNKNVKKYICLLDGCYFVSEFEQDAREHQLEADENHKIVLVEANGDLRCTMQRF